MTIHSEDPFRTPEQERSPVRQVRGRLVSPVTLWASGGPESRAGLTVTSTLVADGEPGHVLGLVDEESDLWERARSTGALVVSVLAPSDRHLAEVFGGLAPAPGGPFRLASWHQTPWGPALADATWCGCRVVSTREVGYALLVDARLEHVELAGRSSPLAHYRGRYRELDLRR